MNINKIEMIIVFILESESILFNLFSKNYIILYLNRFLNSAISFSINDMFSPHPNI